MSLLISTIRRRETYRRGRWRQVNVALIRRRSAERPSYVEPHTDPAVGIRAGVRPIGRDGGSWWTGSTEGWRKSRRRTRTFARKFARDGVRGMHTVIRGTTLRACSRRSRGGWPTTGVGSSLRRGKRGPRGRLAWKLTVRGWEHESARKSGAESAEDLV